MKLKEVLNNMNGETVKLGSASNFVFCGKVDENTEGTLIKLSAEELDSLKNRLKLTKRHDKNFDQIWDMKLKGQLELLEKNAEKHSYSISEKEQKKRELIAKHNKARDKDRKLTDKRLASLPERIKNFTNFTERKVLDRYASEFGGSIIIFEGEEYGQYWTVEEYEEANNGKETI